MEPLQVVWFKRDLRTTDHAPLAAAAARGPVLPLYVVEPDGWQHPDASRRQWLFVRDSLLDLRRRLAALGQPLVVRTGDAVEVFRRLLEALPVAAVHAHQETGNDWTYRRDRAVAALLRDRGVPLFEPRQHGVVRRLRNRDGWARQWEALMGAEPAPVPAGLAPLRGIDPGVVPELPLAATGLPPEPGEQIQPGGRRMGDAVLAGFLERRGEGYSGGISSPVTAWLASSRLSPHLAFGTLSLREVTRACRARRAELRDEPRSAARGQWLRSLKRFEERLHWRCHFMQKLETAPEFEFQNMQRACDGLRVTGARAGDFEAWCRGETGFPLVDACLRQVRARGWLNFRMRALIVSFASYHLWLEWRRTGPWLARQFTDYEAGIHYCQMQMQSGTTGINTLRIYTPVKQSLELDPAGVFIRRWLPELSEVPDRWLHEPWAMPERVQRTSRCRMGEDYPLPIVDHEQAARRARAAFRAVRQDPDANRQADAIQQRHGSRRTARPQRGPRPGGQRPTQGDLFDAGE